MKRFDTSIFLLRYEEKLSTIGLVYFFVFIMFLISTVMLYGVGLLIGGHSDDESLGGKLINEGYGSLVYVFVAFAIIVYATYRALNYCAGIYYKKSILSPVLRKVFQTEDVRMLPGETLDEDVLEGAHLFHDFGHFLFTGEDLFVGAVDGLDFGFCDVCIDVDKGDDSYRVALRGVAMDMELLPAACHYQQLAMEGVEVVVRVNLAHCADVGLGEGASLLNARSDIEWCDEIAQMMGQRNERDGGAWLEMFGTDGEGTRQMLATETQLLIARIVRGVMECSRVVGMTMNVKGGHIRVLLHLKSLKEDVFDVRPIEFFQPRKKAERDIDVLCAIAGIIDDVKVFATEEVAANGRRTVRRASLFGYPSAQTRVAESEAKYKSKPGCYKTAESVFCVLTLCAIMHVAYCEYFHKAPEGVMIVFAYYMAVMAHAALFYFACEESKYRFNFRMYASLLMIVFAAWYMDRVVVPSEPESTTQTQTQSQGQSQSQPSVGSSPQRTGRRAIDGLTTQDVDGFSFKGRWVYIAGAPARNYVFRSAMVLIPDTIRRMEVTSDRQVHQVCVALRDTLYENILSGVAEEYNIMTGYGRLNKIARKNKLTGQMEMNLYIGEVWGGRPNGYGVMFCPDDIKKEGFWRDGKPIMYEHTSPRAHKYVCALDMDDEYSKMLEINLNSNGSMFDTKHNHISSESPDYPLYSGVKSAIDRYNSVSRRATAANYRILKPIIKKYSREVD